MKEFNLINLGNRICSARTHQEMTQQYVCDKLNISQPLLSKIENGGVDISISLLHQISEVLDVSISWLVGENYNANDLSEIERLKLQEYKRFLISQRKNKP